MLHYTYFTLFKNQIPCKIEKLNNNASNEINTINLFYLKRIYEIICFPLCTEYNFKTVFHGTRSTLTLLLVTKMSALIQILLSRYVYLNSSLSKQKSLKNGNPKHCC